MPPASDVPEEGPSIEVEMTKEMMDMLKQFISKMGEKMSQMEQNYSSLENEFKAFKKEPAGKKISDGKTEFNKISGESADDKFNALMAFRQINKK